ncbi:hypothetical protein [Stenotrophomonas sp. SY1]|uniref:hypothetical protein n=1 Tax=Stenotrophomonas sp. SY1 TaxID=477235 RepID=UPI001E601CFE|nr:hypothetical protein [Stenotrophomonas sp. SY1]MCD9087025.1 hypothetical protein [Stenotrophomonas sp. SY1]
MKPHLLSCALATLLAGTAPTARAQQPAQAVGPSTPAPGVAATPQPPPVTCGEQGCREGEGLLLRIRTRGAAEPATQGTDARSGEATLQPDRRVTISAPPADRAIAAGRFNVRLPSGGVIWATEDPNLGQPELSVSAPSLVAFENGRILKPVPFYVRGNYSDFIERMEVLIYRPTDLDLIAPVARVPLDVSAVSQVEWDGVLPSDEPFRAGDQLRYVVRAYGSNGTFDETVAHTLQLVRPIEADSQLSGLRTQVERSQGTALGTEQALRQSLIDAAFAENGLRLQNIPIYGSRIRITGRDIPESTSLTINGDSYPVDMERKFVAEYLVPVGPHRFDIAVSGGADALEQHHVLELDVTGRYFFGIGLADVTIAQNSVSGSIAPFAVDERYQDDVISDGRLAFYAKGKARGKYLITAQADTTEQDIKHLFDGFTEAWPQDIFRRLDPDLYYPTYGDDSTTYRDVDSMGRFYLRVDWDKNQALWGNYATGLTGTEYAQYVRSLYGGALSWRSQAINPWGDPRSTLRLFGAQEQTAPGHNEFIGTGGSLYYLRNTDILPGSDQVVVEIRDRTTGRVEKRIPLQRGTDYEIDELQGRLLLTRSLAQVTRENLPTLTRDLPLDGYEQRLLVDYEWLPSGFDDGELTAGVRGKQWFGDHVGVGVTYVDENRDSQDYTLASGDLTLQAGKGTYLKAEYAHTESFGVPSFFSDNGGFTFIRSNNTDAQREGDAKAIEARANFRELGWTRLDWSAGGWWRETDPGFSIARHDTGLSVTEYGAEALGQITRQLGLYARYSKAESGTEQFTQAQATLEWRPDDWNTLSGELRRVEEGSSDDPAAGLLGALKYSHRFNTTLELYGTVQATLDDDGGRYADNNAVAIGAEYLLDDRASVGAEVSTGDRGDSATLDAEYKLDSDHTLYGAYTYSTDSTEYESLFNPTRQNGWTLGQRWRLSSRTNLFNESQFLKEPDQSGLAHTFGMDFYPAQGWNLGFTLQSGDLDTVDGGHVDRSAVSVSGSRTSADTDWRSKVEWRKDTGSERREQWVTTNRLTHRFNDSWRIAARLNYSRTNDELNALAGARFWEGNVGFAYRPWNSQRWALFGRYTYLYDLATEAQLGGADQDQKTQILSFEGVYKHDAHWELATKLARREGEVRMGRGSGPWFDSATMLSVLQLRYQLRQKWYAMGEYRWLDVHAGGTQSGFLVGVDRDIGNNFRMGVGYNFTDFSDDLTDFDYDHKGWFLNMVGTY